MSKRARKSNSIACPHCGRDDFKSERGLYQHLRTNNVCKVKEELLTDAVFAQASRQEREARVREALATEGSNRPTRSQIQARMQELYPTLAHDEDAYPMETGGFALVATVMVMTLLVPIKSKARL